MKRGFEVAERGTARKTNLLNISLPKSKNSRRVTAIRVRQPANQYSSLILRILNVSRSRTLRRWLPRPEAFQAFEYTYSTE